MENAAPIDRISDLPDDLLSRILSLLPTKLAFSTTVLSKRWTPLSKLLTALYFHDESVDDEDAFFRFCSFVDTVMLSTELIKTFHLNCDSIIWRQDGCLCNINNWIQTAKRHPLENIQLYSSIFSVHFLITLPPTTFTFSTLVVLKLRKFYVDRIISVDLPSLKTLHLSIVIFINRENFNKLLYGCLILEDLTARVHYIMRHESSAMNKGEFKSLSKLIRADIYESDVPFTAIYNVQILKVRMRMKLPEQEINSYNRSFQNLIHLELFLVATNYWDEVMRLLQNCPKLQILSIAELPEGELLGDWKYPNSVPKCISSHIQSCTLKVGGFKVVLEFARYILKYAQRLEVMKIHIKYAFLHQNALEELTSCLKISPKSKISIG